MNLNHFPNPDQHPDQHPDQEQSQLPEESDPQYLENHELDPDAHHSFPDNEPWLDQLEPQHRNDALALYQLYGEAFSEYLKEIYPDISSDLDSTTTLEADFTANYIGSYDSLEDWAEEFAEAQGWISAIKETMYREAIPENLIEFNYEPLVSMVIAHKSNQIIWGESQIHLFHK